jgi:hypothetical protein
MIAVPLISPKSWVGRTGDGYRYDHAFVSLWRTDLRVRGAQQVRRPEPAARAVVAPLSDWFPRTTGEIMHVDGGVHAIGV